MRQSKQNNAAQSNRIPFLGQISGVFEKMFRIALGANLFLYFAGQLYGEVLNNNKNNNNNK